MSGNLPLIVTRAEPGASATVRRAAALGLAAQAMPLFSAHALAWTAPDPADFAALLLTSAQAVRLAGSELSRLAALPAYCVGQATADALEAKGLCATLIGDTGAQPLLDAMASRQITDILWLCGRDRSELNAGDATLTPLPCYAVDPVDPPAAWAAAIAGPSIVLAHSARGAARIAQLAGAARGHLSLVAISSAAAAAAGEGWAERRIAERPDDAAMLAEAHALCHKRE